jgi:uncharacterized damage-inducible protein DinB
VSHLERLAAHLGWADRRTLEALRAAPAADPALSELYAHVVAAEHVWLARLAGTPPRLAVWPSLTLEECATIAAENLDRLTRYVGSLRPDDLPRGITYRNSAGQEFTSTIEDILLHLCLHGAYHRGQIASNLRRAGATPAPTDYIAFIRGSPAATRADRPAG